MLGVRIEVLVLETLNYFIAIILDVRRVSGSYRENIKGVLYST